MKSLRQELGLTPDQVRLGLALLEKPRTITRRGKTFTTEPEIARDEKGRIFLRDLLNAERDIAHHIRRLQAADLPELALPADAFGNKTPDASQLEAVRAACRSNVMIMTGGPGVGKTTVARAIIAAYEAAGFEIIACCAPTGKAAIRMKQQTGREAATIHSTIGLVPGGEPKHDDGAPEYSESGEWLRGGPITADAVVVDETSMVDVRVAASLLRAIPDGARLLIIGDADQLPSIGPGRVLFDLVASQAIACAQLTKIHRQASESRIPYIARDVNAGRLPADLHKTGTDFTHWECQGAPGVAPEVQAAERIVRSLSDKEASIPTRKGFDIRDVQVLAGQYKGPCGVIELNNRLQEALNPTADHNGDVFVGLGYSVRLNDRVINTSNNYDLLVMNGEMGYVVACNHEGLDVNQHVDAHWSGKDLSAKSKSDRNDDSDFDPFAFDTVEEAAEGDDLLSRFGGLKVLKDEDGRETIVWEAPRVVVVDFGDRRIAFTAAEAKKLHLGYCVTVHKSQGSQWKAVVIALHCENSWMLTRPLLYTAITRAEAFCLTVGTTDQLARAARNTRGTERRTVLQERLEKATVPTGTSSLKSLTLG